MKDPFMFGLNFRTVAGLFLLIDLLFILGCYVVATYRGF